MVLLPTKRNKLLLHWRGSYVVSEVVNRLDYRIDIDGRLKTFHANMLKQYCEREGVASIVLEPETVVLSKASAAVVEDEVRGYDRFDPSEEEYDRFDPSEVECEGFSRDVEILGFSPRVREMALAPDRDIEILGFSPRLREMALPPDRPRRKKKFMAEKM